MGLPQVGTGRSCLHTEPGTDEESGTQARGSTSLLTCCQSLLGPVWQRGHRSEGNLQIQGDSVFPPTVNCLFSLRDSLEGPCGHCELRGRPWTRFAGSNRAVACDDCTSRAGPHRWATPPRDALTQSQHLKGVCVCVCVCVCMWHVEVKRLTFSECLLRARHQCSRLRGQRR